MKLQCKTCKVLDSTNDYSKIPEVLCSVPLLNCDDTLSPHLPTLCPLQGHKQFPQADIMACRALHRCMVRVVGR